MRRYMSIAFALCLMLLFGMKLPVQAADPPYPCEEDLIEVMFSPDSRVRLRDGVPVDLATKAMTGINEILSGFDWTEWNRICSLPEERLDELHASGEANTGKTLYNLNNIYRLHIPVGNDIWQISRDLESLPGIILARPVPKPMPPPLVGDYEPEQGYLDSAGCTPTGIDAEYAWTLTGGNGTGVTVCDLEYGWYYNHADITKAVGSQINPYPLSLPAGETDDHGTAVIGVMVSDSNGWGTTGISHGASLKTCGTYYGTSPAWNVPDAITMAINALSAGDVILLEQQWDYYGGGTYVPIEWWLNYSPNDQTYNGVYAAIETAVANGIHVVEAGGNGNVNTGNLNWYGNSGAIIVGAGGASLGPNADLQRLSFSSYGGRFNLQGWGENVVTTGYGDRYNAGGKDSLYTAIFSGTSSASPIVAGAAACCVGFWKGLGWNESLLTPTLLRDVLTWTGTPQDYSVTGHIGPRPNLRAACSTLILQEIEWGDATSGPLANNNGHGMGVAWGDYDDDGLLDIYLSNNGANKLFRNTGGGIFTDATASPLDDAGIGKGVAWADYDNDGNLDLYLVNDGIANKLFRNNGTAFVDTTLGPLGDAGNGQGLAWGDYDNDGWVDLYFSNWGGANKLLKNNGDGSFTDATSSPLGDGGHGQGVAWGDYDNDGYLDLYLANGDLEANKLFHNEGNGTFTDATSGPLGDAGYGTGAAWGDYDNDGYLDLFLVNNGQDNKLFHNEGNGTFTDVTAGPLGGNAAYDIGVSWGDYDNDGDLDLYVTTSYCCNRLLRNDGGGVFTDATTGPISDAQHYSMGGAWGDYDNDGDIDIYQANTGFVDDNKLFENKLSSSNNWLHIDLVGTVSNKSAIGARVRVVVGGASQIREISGGSGYCSQNSLMAEFGLGSATTVDSIIISWPSGIVQDTAAVAVNQLLQFTEPTSIICGDANDDKMVNLGDAVFINSIIFHGGSMPDPPCKGDANGDGSLNLGDAVYLNNHVFHQGPAPVTTCCPW